MTVLGVLMVLLGVVVSLAVAAGAWWGWAVLRDRPVLLTRAGVAEQQVAALDAQLQISQVEYATERALWAAALEESRQGQS